MDEIKIVISKEYNNKTIKEFLKLNNIGRGKVESIRVNKQTFINGEYKHLDTILNENDVLTILIDEEIDYVPLEKTLKTAYEDDYILIVYKPINMLVHPDDNSNNKTLCNMVANYYKSNNIKRKVRYIHRIDKETSGLVIFVKDFISEAILLKDIENHNIKRSYLALVEGTFKPEKGVIVAPIGQDRHKNGKMCVSNTGKDAITEYKVMKVIDDYSVVKFNLKTGRTHQIRVHSSFKKHPLLGDVLYGGNMQYINRVALHSYEVELIHPFTKEKIEVKSSLPTDFIKLIKK